MRLSLHLFNKYDTKLPNSHFFQPVPSGTRTCHTNQNSAPQTIQNDADTPSPIYFNYLL